MSLKQKEISEDSPLNEVSLMQKELGGECVIFNRDFANEMLLGTGLEVGMSYKFHDNKGNPTDKIMTIVGISEGYSGINSGVQNNPHTIQNYKNGMKRKPRHISLWARYNNSNEIGIVDYLTKFSMKPDGRIKYGRHGYLVKEETATSNNPAERVSKILSE